MKKLKTILQSNFLYFFLFIILAFVIFIRTKMISYQTSFSSDTNKIEAFINTFQIDGDKISFYLKEREEFVATYYLKSEEEKTYFQNNLKIGLKIVVEGNQQEILNKTIPNTFDYKKYLYNKKIYFSFLIQKITILDEKISFEDNIKEMVRNRIKKLNNNAYISAFILGDKSLMNEDAKELIQNNGVSHLFALSGMHLSFIYVFLLRLFRKFKFQLFFIYGFLIIYLAIASFPISFIRAILFSLFLELNKKFSIGISSIKVLFLVAFILLLYNPFYLYDVGFIYTFVVTFSLLFCHDYLNDRKGIKQIFLVSLITFLFSIPITVYYNYEINLISFINNIILVPLVSIIIFPMAILTFIFPILLPIFDILTRILECLNIFLANLSFNLVIGKINVLDILIYYVLLMLFLKLRFKFLLFFMSCYLMFIYHKEYFIGFSSVYFIDVGQGDSTLLVAPKNKEVILIDTGGKISYQKEDWQVKQKEFNLGESILAFLKSKRIRKIDLLLITHGDLDHLGYASFIVDHIKVESTLINFDEINIYEREIIEKTNRVFNYDAKYFYFNILSTKMYDNENDNSVVTLWQIEQIKFLLMGDASMNVEQEILKKYQINADFLKVGHHGSNTSSSKDFVSVVNPTYAVISAGRNNRYNHPSKETVKTLNDLSISVLNTQELGTIEIRIKKNVFNIIPTLT